MIKFKNWLIKIAIKGLVKHHKDVCNIIESIEKKLENKYK